MFRRLISWTMTWAICVGLLGGCGDSGRQAEFIFAVHDEHNAWDPQQISWVADGRIADCLYEPLVRYTLPELDIEPGVAERWEIADDGRTYTFYLRDTAKWSNGDPVTAHDFVYAWRRAMLPDLAADYTQLMWLIDGAEALYQRREAQLEQFGKDGGDAQALLDEATAYFDEHVGLRAVDDHTLEVRLVRPTPYFLEMCAFVTFLPAHRASLAKFETLDPQTGTVRRDDGYFGDPKRLVSNGPYRLAGRRFKRDVDLVANEHYWDAANVTLKSIRERIVQDVNTALHQYEAGDIDWLPDVPTADETAARLIEEQRDDTHLIPAVGQYFYNFNCIETLEDGSRNPNFIPLKVRQALSLAINREAIVRDITRMGQPVAVTYIPENVLPGYDSPTEAGYRYDIERARALLAEAGYPGGEGLAGLKILYNNNYGHESIARYIKRSWEGELGVVVGLEGVENNQFKDRLKNHQFAISRASWFGDYRDPTTWLDKLRTDNGNNDCGYSNPAYDALLDRAAAETDRAQRMALLREAEAMLLADAPMAFMYQYVNMHLFDPAKVKGLYPNGWNRTRLDRVEVVQADAGG